MQIASREKGIPVIGIFALLMAVAFIAKGAFSLRSEDPAMPWIQILFGAFLLVSWVSKIRHEVIQVVVDDNEIRYRRRNERDLVVPWSDLIDFEVLPSRINFRYKGMLDVQSATIPLRRFDQGDTERIQEIFAKEEAQAVSGNRR